MKRKNRLSEFVLKTKRSTIENINFESSLNGEGFNIDILFCSSDISRGTKLRRRREARLMFVEGRRIRYWNISVAYKGAFDFGSLNKVFMKLNRTEVCSPFSAGTAQVYASAPLSIIKNVCNSNLVSHTPSSPQFTGGTGHHKNNDQYVSCCF